MSVEDGLLPPWAVDADSSGNPEYSGLAVRELFSALFEPGKAPLRAKPGILRGLEVTVSGQQAKIKPGVCLVDASQGTCLTGVAAEKTLDIPPGHATYSRKDIIIIRVNDSGDDRGVSLSFVQGTPGAYPASPTTPTGGLTIATILTPRASGGAPTVTLGEKSGLAGVIGNEKRLLVGTNFTGTIECHKTGNMGMIVFNNVVLKNISDGRWDLPLTGVNEWAKANSMGVGLLRVWLDSENYLVGRISDSTLRIDGIPNNCGNPITGTIPFQPLYPL